MCVCVCAQLFSHVRLFATLWTVDSQAPLSMNFLGKNTGVGATSYSTGIYMYIFAYNCKILSPYRLLQNNEYNSLCCTVGSGPTLKMQLSDCLFSL